MGKEQNIRDEEFNRRARHEMNALDLELKQIAACYLSQALALYRIQKFKLYESADFESFEEYVKATKLSPKHAGHVSDMIYRAEIVALYICQTEPFTKQSDIKNVVLAFMLDPKNSNFIVSTWNAALSFQG